MPVTLLVPAALQRYSDGRREVEVGGARVADALEALFRSFPPLRPRVVGADGRLHPYLILFRNGRQLGRDAAATEPLTDGDTLDLVGAVEGGRPDDVRMRGFRERATVERARAEALRGLAPLAAEDAPLDESAGRVLAVPIVSPIDVPPFARAAMDGYAVRAEDTFGASLYAPLALALAGESMPGELEPPPVARGQAVRIMTGAPMPQGADAVLMAEDAELEDGRVLARAAVAPHKNVGRVGEDVAAGETILAAGRVLRPQDVGLLASIGFGSAPVYARPRVRILVTGNELLAPGETPRPGRIVDSNTPMLAALAARDGALVVERLRLGDERGAIADALARPGADVVLAAGGSSVGREDWLPVLVRELGELPVHGVAMRPSAPTGIGRIGSARVFLLPGNPVSCLCAYDFFAGPALRVLGGRAPLWPYPSALLPLARRITSRVGRLDYVRVRVEDGRVTPLAIAGASALSSTTRASGFALVADDSEGLDEGELVRVYLYDQAGASP